LDEIGDGWSLLVLRSALMGVRTFHELEERLEIPASTLTRRLAVLCERGIHERRRYQERPPRDEYVLTQKGLELLPVVLAIAAWGNRWLVPEGVAIQPVDAKTGAKVHPEVVDRATGKPLAAGGVALAPGPAASARVRRGLTPPKVLGAERGAS
ncbi:MAG: winged helix-turn-helix transcriptional regulator, partial [Polyangiales bacterium]